MPKALRACLRVDASRQQCMCVLAYQEHVPVPRSCGKHHLQGVWGAARPPSGEREGQSPLASTSCWYSPAYNTASANMIITMPPRLRSRALLIAVLALVLLGPGRALAHGGHTGPMQTFTQQFGPYEIAITVEIPPTTPAPLYLDIAPQQDMAGVTMRFRIAPRGQHFDGAPVAELQGTAGTQGIYFSQLDVDRFGDWDLEARISGPKGGGVARIPVTITAQPLPVGSIGLFAGLGGLVVLMISSIALSVIAQ